METPASSRSGRQKPSLKKIFIILLIAGMILRIALSLGVSAYGHKTRPDDPIMGVAALLNISDAAKYHRIAAKLTDVWNKGCIGPGNLEMPRSYSALLSLFYYLFGKQIWIAGVLNALLSAALGLAAFRLAAILGADRPWAMLAGILVSLWPPSFIWGAAPLRELLSTLMILIMLGSLLRLSDPGQKLSRGKLIKYGLAYVFSIYLFLSMRDDYLMLLSPFIYLTALIGMAWGLGRKRLLWIGRMLCVLILGLSAVYLSHVQPLYWVAFKLNHTPADCIYDYYWKLKQPKEIGIASALNFLNDQYRMTITLIPTLSGRRAEFVQDGGSTLVAEAAKERGLKINLPDRVKEDPKTNLDKAPAAGGATPASRCWSIHSTRRFSSSGMPCAMLSCGPIPGRPCPAGALARPGPC